MLDPQAATALASALVDRAIKAGATAADAIYVGDRSTSVSVRMGALEDVGSAEGKKVGLRLFLGQQVATVAGSDLGQESLATLVERGMAMAREATPDDYAGLAPADLLASGVPAELELYDAEEPDPANLKARALDAEGAALAVPGVTNSSGAGASHSAHVVALATSGGFASGYRSSRHGVSASVIAGDGAGMQRDHDWHSVRQLGDLDDARTIGRRAGERAVARLNSGKPKPGRYPVIFDPRVSNGLLMHFTGAISGSSVARGTTFLKDMLGAQLFAPGVTISDDPLRVRGLRSHPFDGEGLRVARTDLVSDGRLNQWIAESASARQLGIQPTGHAVRGAGGAPFVSPSNLWIEPGQRSRADLLAAFPEALLVIELIGQGVNGLTGDYSRGAVGFMVRGGAICEAVSEVTIASNLKEMFATLEPGSDFELRHGIDAPTILIPEMTIAAA
ncbi:MAG: metallopeptidase TldD-related protein [Sphingomicrobium sp.]